MKRLLLLLLVMMGWIALLSAQGTSGAITGKVVDEKGEPIINATVQLFIANTVKGGAVTDFDGNYLIKPLNPGRYDVKVKYIGYKESITKNVLVQPSQNTEVNFKLYIDEGAQLEEVVITEYKVPLIDKYQAGSTTVKTSDQIERMPTRSTSNVVSTMRGRRNRRKNVTKGVQAYGSTYMNPSRESYKKNPENDFKSVAASPLSTMSIDVDRASYSNVRRYLNNNQLPPADAVRVEEMINYFSYDYPQPDDDPIAIVTEITNCPWKEEHKLLHIGMQAKKIATENLPASNLVFLIDVSGSMQDANKLPLVIESMKLLAKNLREKDKIAIVVYAGNAGLVLPTTKGSNQEAIFSALDGLTAGGSTAGGAGIKLAYKTALQNYIHGGNNRVILATDGDFNVGVSGDNELETLITKEREKGIYLTCLGYGMGNYKDSKMEVLADKGNGNYAYIDNIDEAKKTLVKEFGGTVFTIAKDVKAQIEFNPNIVKGYRLIGYENRLLNDEDFKDDKKDAGDMGSGHSVTIIYEIIPVGANSKNERDVDDLKYTRMTKRNVRAFNDEAATIKFRYKKPNGKTSRELAHVIPNKTTDITEASEDVQFATSVSAFGMLLKNSAHKGNANFNMALSLVDKRNARKDEYRSEYIKLVKTAQKLSKEHPVAESDEVREWYKEE